MIKLIIPGKPMGKQRPRVMRTGITYTPKETVNYETLVKQLYIASNSNNYLEGPLRMNIAAYFEIPKSASNKQKQLMQTGLIRPTKKPDMDNIVKIIADALNGIAYHDDSQIVELSINKFYSDKPRIEIELAEVVHV